MNIEKAKEIAKKAHQGQKRWDKSPYINHPEKVAKLAVEEVELIEKGLGEKFSDLKEKVAIVGWLHDVVEDSDITLSDLKEAGFDKDVLEAVNLITKKPGQKYYEYITGLYKNELASIVKMADLTHNMSDLKPGSMRDKYEFAYQYLSGELW